MKYKTLVYDITMFENIDKVLEQVRADLLNDSTASVILCADKKEYMKYYDFRPTLKTVWLNAFNRK